MKEMKGFMVAVLLVVIGLGVWLGFFARDSYTGKETFHTEQEYTMFKEVISNPTVSIDSMQSLASVPPIVVNFKLTVPKDEVFPYGKKNSEQRVAGYLIGAVGLMCLCSLLFVPIKEEEEGK